MDQYVIVQASSMSWSGAPDMCMNEVNGVPVVWRTVEKVLAQIEGARVILAAPSADATGAFAGAPARFGGGRVTTHFGQDESPLARMIAATRALDADVLVLRVDGLHMFFDADASRAMLRLAAAGPLDCVKLPDDFPAQFTSDVYRVGALRRAEPMLPPRRDGDIYRVHPKFFLFQHPESFRCRYLPNPPRYDDATLRQARETARQIYRLPRQEVNGRRIWSGDQIGYHYEIALRHLRPEMKVLDLACGAGHGVRAIAASVREAHGGDLDAATIAEARAGTPEPNAFYHVVDGMGTGFDAGSFDAVLSMETIEHVDDEDRFVAELHRVLAPGGVLVLSTPQNSQGHIPITYMHEREYSLEQITSLVGRYFRIDETIGLKQGLVSVPGDGRGQNTVIVARKA
ncbi:MAG TPA: methyltransferase domain-containing protein [Vicinamibacterales bacterium]|nr:methyltransferase domain-containing protein [Vicinamibacterales bacterium]